MSEFVFFNFKIEIILQYFDLFFHLQNKIFAFAVPNHIHETGGLGLERLVLFLFNHAFHPFAESLVIKLQLF
jgi:hypothetical protein